MPLGVVFVSFILFADGSSNLAQKTLLLNAPSAVMPLISVTLSHICIIHAYIHERSEKLRQR